MNRHPVRFVALFGIAAVVSLISMVDVTRGQERPLRQAAELTIDSIFNSNDLDGETFVGQWQSDSQGFERIKRDAKSGNTSIIRVNLSASAVEQVLVSSKMLTHVDTEKPLSIDSYQWSHDKTKLLIFTNTERVWRYNTRGDYWVLDMESKSLMQVGGDASASSLMFAKFSPDAKQVAYVYKNDLYIQNLKDRSITRLTDTAKAAKINGTFDWV